MSILKNYTDKELGLLVTEYVNNGFLKDISYVSRLLLEQKEWLCNSPTELTPWFGIAGAMYCNSLIMFIEKINKRVKV